MNIPLPSIGPRRVTQPWARIVILLISLVGIAVVARIVTGQFLPSDAKSAVIFQNVLLLIVLGSALLEHKFTKPADSAVNALMGMLTLLPVVGMPNRMTWALVFLYCSIVWIMATTCVAVSTGPHVIGWRRKIADLTYTPSVVFGSSRVLFSIVFLYAVFSFYTVQSYKTALLVLFWGVFIALWPLRVPELLSSLTRRKDCPVSVGRVIRTDAPNIIHAALESGIRFERGAVKILAQADGKQRFVVPLFSQPKEDHVLGTCLCVSELATPVEGLQPGCLYEPIKLLETTEQLLGGDKESRLVGFVDRDSKIAELRFQTWNPTDCKQGMLVWARIGNKRVYYQITEGTTEEESLEADRHGYQIASAS